MTIGDRIRKRRQELGWSQRALAQRITARQATIADLERGAQQETSTALIRRLARALGVTADWLIGMYDDDDPEPAVDRPAICCAVEGLLNVAPARPRG